MSVITDSINAAFKPVGDAFTNRAATDWCMDVAAAFSAASTTSNDLDKQIKLAFSQEGWKQFNRDLGIQTDGLNNLCDTLDASRDEDWKRALQQAFKG